MIKLKFFSDYDNSENLLERFKQNYNVYDRSLNFTVNDDYNYAIIFNRANESIRPWARTVTIIQEPSWSEAHQYVTSLTNTDFLIIHDRALFEKKYQIRLENNVIESPSFMFYHDHLPQSFFHDSETIKKNRKISMIVSGQQFSRGNYRKRLGVLDQILASDLDIDIYGRNLNIRDDRYKGRLEYKYVGLMPYEYSIAIENSNEKNYITEKFFDCVICNTTPIYNGAPNISEVYDPQYFRTIDLDSQDIVNEIKQIISSPAPGAGPNKKIYFERYNLYTKLKEIIRNDR